MNEKQIIEKIEMSIDKNHKIFTSVGVVNGLAGLSLFYFYLGNISKSLFYIERSIEGLTEFYKGDDIIRDIIEIGALLEFYCDKKFLSYKDVKEYFDNYDPIIEDFFVESLSKNNLNPVTGTIKYANYFINRSRYTGERYHKILLRTLEKIEELMEEDSKTGGIYWRSTINRDGKYLIELGIRHGIMGIIDFIVSLYDIGIEKNKSLSMIKRGMLYVMNKKLTKEVALFPFCVEKLSNRNSFSFNLNYGDLGIAYVINRIIKKCNLLEYKEILNEMLYRFSTYRDDESKMVPDASLFYGCIGVASLLSYLRKETNFSLIDESINYWFSKIYKHLGKKTIWAGFDTTYNKFDVNAQLSMSHGITGIGIGLLGREYNSTEFLSFLGYRVA